MLTVCTKNLDEAKEVFLNSFENGPKRSEIVHIDSVLNRVLANKITAPEDFPPFSRSLIDGYALTSKDTIKATENKPVALRLVGKVEMGVKPSEVIDRSLAMFIPTGGMLPHGADAVARIENCRENGGGNVKILSSISEKENVAFKGDDIKKGKEIIPALTILKPLHIGLMAEFNILEARVSSKPKAAIFSTGNEIVKPNSELKPGQIRDCNSYTMAAMVKEAGGVPLGKGIIKDDFDSLRDAIIAALEDKNEKADIIVVTGGTAVGRKDFTAEVFDSIGDPGVLVNGVAMKGGRPVILANVQGTPLVGLPGYPPNAVTWFDIFVKPAIKRLLGIKNGN